MTESPARARIAEVLTDYASGHLDSIEDAVDAIVEAVGGDEVLALVPVNRRVIGGRDG